DRVSVANGKIAEAVVLSPHEVVVNGKAMGSTSLIVWQSGGKRTLYLLRVRPDETALDGVRRELRDELAGQSIRIETENGVAFLRGTVRDLGSADRAVAITAALGKTVNLLRVEVPETEPQILLRVKFATVDRSVSTEFGINFLSTGVGNTTGRVATQQFSQPAPGAIGSSTGGTFTLQDALNIFLFNPSLNLGATIRALEAKNLMEILAEPNVLAINGKSASFLAGGEFPYPTLQGGGAGLGSITIQFREFGIRLGFRPLLTPRGTIRLQVTPEVSALDYANGLTFQGFTIPGLTTRRVQTEIELASGQSFAIGGLLDNRVTESLSKIPLLGDLPWMGKFFQSRMTSRNNTELVVLVTPEIVQPVPVGMPVPEVTMPRAFLEGGAAAAPRTPGTEITGAGSTGGRASARPAPIPVEELREIQRREREAPPAKQTAPAIELLPVSGGGVPATAPPPAGQPERN
ncbi:MAG: pilus assembly protein N-terminal domain-containing protein, partial [Acidobacteriota bacterium]